MANNGFVSNLHYNCILNTGQEKVLLYCIINVPALCIIHTICYMKSFYEEQDVAPNWSICSWCDGSSDWSFMVELLSYFSFQPVFHVLCNKGNGMCCPACCMVHVKEPLLLIGKSSPCGGSRFLSC